jgi:cytochrome P450
MALVRKDVWVGDHLSLNVILANSVSTTTAAVGTVDHDLHRMRRAALNPYFSKASVNRLESTVQSNVDLLCARLRSRAGSAIPINLSDAFTCLSADVIGSYTFGRSYGFLQHPDFMPRWRSLMMVSTNPNARKDPPPGLFCNFLATFEIIS